MQEVHTLICHDDIGMALKCLSSLESYSLDPVRFVFHDDGSLTVDDEYSLLETFCSSRVIWKKDADDFINANLKNYPNCLKFRNENIMALKLFDVSLFSDVDIAYCDTDILFFRPFNGLFSFNDANTSAIFLKDHQEAYSLYPWHLIGPNKLNLVSRLNAGMLLVRKKSFDLDFIEWLLTNVSFRSIPVWIEQTCWAALAYKIGCRLWDPEVLQVITGKTIITKKLIAGHFARSVRYRLDDDLKNEFDNIEYIDQITTIDSCRCSYLNIALERIKSRIYRILSL